MRNYLQFFLIYLSLTIFISGFAFGQELVKNHSKLSHQGAQVELPENLFTQNAKGYYWFEGFDDGALPDGWQNVVNEGNGFEFALVPYSHTLIYYFGDLQRDARLVTPLLDLSGLETVTLGITHRIYAYGSGWSNKILISNDGNNWETVAEFTEAFEPDDNRYMEFDITLPAKDSEQVYLAFAADYPLLADYYEVVWEIVDVTVFEPVDTYNVSFVVEDEGGNALNDAIVSLNGTTNAAGEYLFADFEAGTYDYTVELDGYITAEGQVTVIDQDVQETVVLSQPVVITEFPWFEGFDDGALPDGWQNVVNEGNGFEFELSPYSHTLIYYFGDLQRDARLVTPLLDLSGLETVTLGITHRIYAYGSGWSNKILISNDGNNWETVAEFTEGFEPDDNRYMEFDITLPAKGSEQVYLAFAADYPLLADYYEVVWEIVDVTVFEPVDTYNVSFVVEDEGGNALNDAIVSLNGTTNAAGEYLFADLEAGTYDYTVELDGYITAEGQVTVIDQDVQETVVLSQPVVIHEFPWFEGFDDGALPDGWQNVVNEGSGFEFELSPYSHTVIYYFGDLQRDARLVTPLLDLSGLETVTLGITHRIYAYGSGWSNKILISNDGSNWETVAEFTEGFEPDDNRYMEFDITLPAKGSEQVYLAFAADYPLLADYYEVVWEIVDVTVFEPVDTYNVSFVVEDEGGNALNDAIVSLNGTTNAVGEYLFADFEAGTYDYTVELDGYITAEGQVTVIDQDVQETVVLSTGQYVELPEGWSLISSYIIPDDASFEQIFADQLEDGNINILLGDQGIFWPGFNINTLGAWNNYQGYKIKMNAIDRVGIAGTMVENKTIHLTTGTSYLPVLSDVAVYAGELFAPLAGKLNFALDLLDGLIYWPQGQIYTLEHLIPGRAYLVAMAEEGTVYYDEVDNAAKTSGERESAYPAGFTQFAKTGSPHLISIAHHAMEKILEAGDLIAAFDSQNQCVGAVTYTGESKNLGLIVFGDDQTTDLKDGLNDGEEISLRLIKSDSHEFIDLDATWSITMPNQRFFTENGLSGISELKASALSITDHETVAIDVYPNPATELVSFTMHNTENAIVEIYDSMGRMVLKSEINKNQNTCNVSLLSTGVYVVKIHTQQNHLLTTKLIIE